MKILDWPQFISPDTVLPPLAMTIGVFDGIHKGHQALVSSIRKKPSATSCVCTFTGNPLLLFAPEKYHGDILSVSQKIALFREMGVQLLILIDFSYDFSKLSGRDFLSKISMEKELCFLSIGENHRFGRDADTSSQDAKRILSGQNIPVDIIPPVTYKGLPISSTRIRGAIKNASFSEAKDMMGRPFCLDISHCSRERKHGTVVVNTDTIRQIVPPPGEYSCGLIGEDGIIETEIIVFKENSLEWNQKNSDNTKYIVFS